MLEEKRGRTYAEMRLMEFYQPWNISYLAVSCDGRAHLDDIVNLYPTDLTTMPLSPYARESNK